MSARAGRDEEGTGMDESGATVPSVDARVRVVAAVLGVAVLVAAGITATGGLLDVSWLQVPGNDLPQWKFNAAVATGALAAAVCLCAGMTRTSRAQRWARGGAGLFAVLGGTIALVTLIEWIFAKDLGIDELVVAGQKGVHSTSVASRPAFVAVVVLVALAGTLSVVIWSRQRRPRAWAEGFALIGLAFSVGESVAYLYGVDGLIRFGGNRVAPLAALSLAALSVAVLLLTNGPVVRIFLGSLPGSRMIRRLLLTGVTFLVVAGGVEIAGENAGIYSGVAGTTWLIITSLVFVFLALALSGAEANRSEVELARIRAAEAARAELLRVVLDSAVDPMLRYDGEGRVEYVNEQLVELTGLAAEACMGRTSTEMGYPEDVEAAIRRVLETGETVTFDTEADTTAGHRSFESIASPLFAPDGTVAHVISTSRDVTERKAVAGALEAAREDLLEAQRIAHVGSWSLDVATGHVVWSNELYLMQGLDPKDPPPDYTYHSRLFAPESWERLSVALHHTQETGVPYDLELELIRPDGTHGWMRALGEVVRDAGDAIVGLRGVAEDITARKAADLKLAAFAVAVDASLKAEQLVATATAELHSSLESSDFLISALRHLGVSLGFTRTYVRLLNSERQASIRAEWCAPGVASLISVAGDDPPATLRPFLEQAIDTFQVVMISSTTDDHRVTSDQQRAFERIGVRAIVIAPISIGGRAVGALVADDAVAHQLTPLEITTIERIAREIGAAVSNAEVITLQSKVLAELKTLETARAEFISNVSHELRSPLTGILGYVELLEDETSPLDDEQRHMLEVIDRSAHRLLALVEDLLTISRIEAGNFPLTMSRIELNTVIERAADMFLPIVERRGLTLTTTVESGLEFDADPVQLERVVANLLSNSVKFTDAGGQIEVVGRRDGGDAVISVRDTGIGVPLAEQHNLFTRFFRSSLSQQGATQGTGLGLYIVKQIVDGHGGTVEATSKPGEGTTITVRLPLAVREGP